MAPEDPINLFTNALGLLARDGESHAAEADGLLRRALQLAPVGELAEKIKAQQRQQARPCSDHLYSALPSKLSTNCLALPWGKGHPICVEARR